MKAQERISISRGTHVAPFQGFSPCGAINPGLTPWARMCGPFRAVFNSHLKSALLLTSILLSGIARAGDATVKMDFKDAPLDAILERLSNDTGLIIVKDTAIDGKFTIVARERIPLDEAIETLNCVLKEKGFIAIRSETAEKVVSQKSEVPAGKLLTIKRLEEKKKLNIRVRSSDPDKVSATDEIITQDILIQYIDALQLKKDLESLFPSFAGISVTKRSNKLTVTDTSANLKRLLRFLGMIDTPKSESLSRDELLKLLWEQAGVQPAEKAVEK